MSTTHATVANGRLVSLRLTSGETTTTVAGAEAATTEGETATTGETTAEVPKDDPSPLQVEPKELIPGLASFAVLFLLLRYVFYPKVHGAMVARTEHVTKTLAESDAIRDGAHQEVADYKAELATVHEEAAARIDAARQTVEAERADKMAGVNARLAERRAAAVAASEAAKASMSDQVHTAASDVASQVVHMVLGKVPNADVVKSAVTTAMGASK
jgi:F-type H+-transporting ATPase subunit b